jgi:peptide/nickel transport system substrate-binding protein
VRSIPGRMAAVALVGVAVGGCGGGSGGAAPGATVVTGGVLTFATDSEPECLDPQVSAFDSTAFVDRGVFDSLVSLGSDGAFHPWLAERWTVSKDGLGYTFFLKKGVSFHDGTPFDAAAVKDTLDHAVNPKTKSRYAASLVHNYAGATVVDGGTIEVRLSKPDAAFLQSLSTAYLGIQSPKSLRENAADVLCTKPVGSGPFKLASWTKNTRIELTRNPDYNWGPATAAHTGPARLDGVTIQLMPENAVRFGALTSGQVDAISNVPPNSAKSVPGSVQLLRADSPGAVHALRLNSSKRVLADERVRIALQRGVDLDALVQSVYFGQYRRAWSLLSPSTLGYDKSTEGSWRYDPELSARLLDEAGWTGRDAEGFRTKNGARLTIRWPYSKQLVREQRDILAQGVQAGAKKLGIAIDYVGEDTGQFTQSVLGGNLDILDTSFVRAEPDIMRRMFASTELPSTGGGNIFGIKDAQLDSWLGDAVSTSDPKKRAELYAKAQHYVLDHALVVPTYIPGALVGASTKTHELRFDPQAFPTFYDAWISGHGT